jgi:hypothetical protein
MARGSASKKTALASEQERPDTARKRERWKARQGSIDLERLVAAVRLDGYGVHRISSKRAPEAI